MPSADFCAAVRRPRDRLSRLVGDTEQTSRGKLNRLRCTTAGSTLYALDGYGLRDTSPARPALAPRIRFLFIGSHLCSTLPSDPASRPLDDGRICLSNNAAERALRGIALGRRAWLFAGSDRGGERAAAMYT